MNTNNPASLNPAEAPQQATEGPNLDALFEQTNIAEHLDDELLVKIGDEVHEGYRLDCTSKSNWDKLVDDWVSLAAQLKEDRQWPWRNAANVKFPLLSTAALQFAARAYPALVPADGKVVNMKVIGADPQGVKALKADKLAKHMNYQLLVDMNDWEEEMDRLLIQLPIVGCLFKKTYFDGLTKKNVSRLLGPKDLVVNYWATSLEAAYRKTEIIPMTKNRLRSYINAKEYLDVELPDPASAPELPKKADVQRSVSPSKADETTPYVILEQHTWYDIDKDGYAEPYIITIEEQSKKVLRIVARWDQKGIKTNNDGDVLCIEPVEYYTKYGFIPNPDGGFYDVGFGHLLGPLNESANTIINQLIDAGTLSNLQSGFIGKGLRMKAGETRLQPGEWRAVNATGDDIKKQIFPIPVKEPSAVLFQLLELIIQSSKELASVAEIFVGKMPGQNTPATTTMATIEQGMKVFTAIYKRVFRAQTKEFKKLFRLNSLYPENVEKAKAVLDEPIETSDYDLTSYDVCPSADPTAVSSTQKLLKAQGLMEILPLGTVNVMEVTKRILEAQEQPNVEALMQQQQLPPDPKAEAVKAKSESDQKMAQVKMQTTAQSAQVKMATEQAKQKMAQEDHQMEMAKAQWDAQMKQQNALMDQRFMKMEKMIEMQLQDMKAAQEVRHADQKHQQQLIQMKEKGDAQRAAARMAGKSGNSGTK